MITLAGGYDNMTLALNFLEILQFREMIVEIYKYVQFLLEVSIDSRISTIPFKHPPGQISH